MKILTLLALFSLLASCSSTTGSMVDFSGVVKKRAAYDFNCPEVSVNTVQIELMKYGAQGCGKKAEYKVKCGVGPCVAQPL